MGSNKKFICIAVLSIMFFTFWVFFITFNRKVEQTVTKVISPTEFILDGNTNFKINEILTADPEYTDKNKALSKTLNLSEDEIFILGLLGKYWAKNLVEGRQIYVKDNNLIYYKFGYITRLKNSPFAFENEKPCNTQAFNRQLDAIKHGNFVILDLDTDISYPVSKTNREKVKNFVLVRKNHIKSISQKPHKTVVPNILYKPVFKAENIKIIVTDLTTKIKPDRNCSSDICKEILSHIQNSKNTIDIAIYGYSSTPKIEEAITEAKARGVKIRLVYDIDSKGSNIYPDTNKFLSLITDNKSDKTSAEVRNTMHNKFYIFDKKVVITGSANLSHTDMSGYNTNSVIIINSEKIAQAYSQEFEQMYNGKFHNDKALTKNKNYGNIKIFFSPQDKAITNGIIPLIKNAKKYIYIPAFVITENNLTNELISANKRGIDIKIIADALNASTTHSKHRELRSAGIAVKAENYAGKMHSKTIVIDDEYLIIGSMNFSNSGENRNDENMIILTDSNAAKFYKNFFLYQWNKIPNKWLKHTPRAEGNDSVGSCSDGIDNNYDGKIDKEDEGCFVKNK